MAQAEEVFSFTFSSDALAERERLAFFREEFARRVLRLDMEPLGETPFHVEWSFSGQANLRVCYGRSSPLSLNRSMAMIPPDEASVGLVLALDSPAMLLQNGKEVALAAGDAAVISHHDPARLVRGSGLYYSIAIPSARLAPMIGDVEAAYTRRIPANDAALRLLGRYLGFVRETMAGASSKLWEAASSHIHDLAALAIGSTREGTEIASGRGVRAARLQAVRSHILANLASPDLSVSAVAARQGITQRYVHMLFEETGLSFSQFVLRERLSVAWRMLSDPCCDRTTITMVAGAVGFSDLSYFNRAFRQRYGMSPREARRHRSGRR